MKKKSSLVLFLALAVMLLVGCFKKGEVDDKTRSLTVLLDTHDGFVRNFNPFNVNAHQFVQGFTHEHLVIFDTMNEGREIMWLAEDIISKPDNRTLIVKVREGIKWSDGEPFTAEDVAFTFTISREHPELDRGGSWGENGRIESVKVLDDYTVEIVMREENRFHRKNIFTQNMMIPKHIWSKVENPSTYIMKDPVVTGPFSVVKHFTPEMVVLGRNPNYWKGDELKVDELVIPQTNGNEASLALLQTGQVDWTTNFIPDIDRNYIQGDPNRKYWYGMNDGVRLAFNYMTKHEGNLEAFNIPEFKKAISMAVDREGIIDSAVFGYLDRTVPPVTGLPAGLLGYRDPEAQAIHAKYTVYDLESARELLKKADFKDINGNGFVETPSGKEIRFDILSPAGWSDWNDGAAIVSEGLRKIGINARARAVDLGIIIETWGSGEHDVLYTAYGNASDIYTFYYNTIGDASRALTQTWWSVTQTNYINEEINDLIAQMPHSTEEELLEIVSYVERHFAENMINVPILYNGNWFVYNTSRWTGWATEDNPYVQPAVTVHDTKVYHLLNLRPVE